MLVKIHQYYILISILKYMSCTVDYHSDITKFQVGSHKTEATSPHCPCELVNSYFNRSCGVMPKVKRYNIPANWTSFGEFPWQVAIVEKYEEEFLCSGVLISPRVVLTAARCIQDIPISHIRVRLGEWDILNENKNPLEPYGSVEIAVTKKYFNYAQSDINSSGGAYDVGILKMKSPVNFDDYPHIAPICLPWLMNKKANLSQCFVSGWHASSMKPLNELMKAYADNVNSVTEVTQSMMDIRPCNIDNSKCDRGHHSKNLDDGVMASTLDLLFQDVDDVTAQIRETLEDNINSDKETSTEESPTKEEILTRVLWKSPVQVLDHSECKKIMKDLNATNVSPNQICIAATQSSKPCLGDIGSPVICRILDDKKRNSKDVKTSWERVTNFAVVGIITQSYSCNTKDEGSLLKYPVLAISISKSLDHICHVVTSSSKE